MSSEAIATVVKMMESLSDATQNQVAEFLQTYIADCKMNGVGIPPLQERNPAW